MKEVSVEQLLRAALQIEEENAPPMPSTGWLQSLIQLRALESENSSQDTDVPTSAEADNNPSKVPATTLTSTA